MKKNFILVIALMFALVTLLSVGVSAVNSGFGPQIALQQDDAANFNLDEDNMSTTQCTFNFSLTYPLNGTANITEVQFTLPASFQLNNTPIDSSANNAGNVSAIKAVNTSYTYNTTIVMDSGIAWQNTSLQVIKWYNTSLNTSGAPKINDSAIINLALGVNVSFWFNASATNPGEYTIEVKTTYNTSFTNTTNVSVIINDKTAPTITAATHSGSTGWNTSITGLLNLTITDNNETNGHSAGQISWIGMAFKPSDGRYIGNGTLWNASQEFLWNRSSFNELSNRSSGGNYWNATINYTVLAEGNWTVIVNATDAAGNSAALYILNVSVMKSKYEVQTCDCTPSSINVGGVITCAGSAAPITINGTDYPPVISYSPSSWATTSIGTYTVYCIMTNVVDWIDVNSTDSYIVSAASGPLPSNGGGGISLTTVYNIGDLETDVATRDVGENEGVKFTIGSYTYTTSVSDVTETEATITLEDETITLAIGGVGKVDVDDNGVYDVSITLNGITDNDANLGFKEISETVPAEVIGEDEGEEGAEGEAEEVEAKKLIWLWIVLGVIVIGIIVFFVLQRKKIMGVFLLTLFSKNGKSLRRKK